MCPSIVSNFSWDGCSTQPDPGEIENKGYTKFGGAGERGGQIRFTSGVEAIMYLVHTENFA